MYAWSSHPLLVLCAIFSLLQLLVAYDIGKDVEPGPLGVLLDVSLARSWPLDNWPEDKGGRNSIPKRSWVFSSHLVFNQPTDRAHISDEQLTSIAIDAFKEMEQLWTPEGYDIGKEGRPSVMTALAYGNEIILSSSQKGRVSFSYGDPQWQNPSGAVGEGRPRANRVLNYLDLCEQMFLDRTIDIDRTEVRHRTGAKCGEELAAHAYYRIHQDNDADLSNEHGRVTTVQRDLQSDQNLNKGIHAIDPCNTTPGEGKVEWGCAQFAREMNLTPLTLDVRESDRGPEYSYDLRNLAGGLNGDPRRIDICQRP
ncbi:hypothetical protein CPLU01_05730 [Colletotrichum plurivorum]|uniref:Uncharacterized protein n=1 Tax=Colletotrichum plurivorum TaxID=2175906 RepID=A0A8H6KLD1_9PEZI|nr:hypothetical protein CPLU01_05730 [Colletotrichum plurivorum]